MLDLLGAQHYASYVWDPLEQRFDGGTHINMDPANLDRYVSYYQHHDPITPSLQKHRQAVRVTDVMPQSQLRRTEFFNDFLARDGLYWGVNLYAWSGERNIRPRVRVRRQSPIAVYRRHGHDVAARRRREVSRVLPLISSGGHDHRATQGYLIDRALHGDTASALGCKA